LLYVILKFIRSSVKRAAPMAQQGIRSLEAGIGVFRQVHELRRPATLTEIARLARMEPAKAHRYCVSLIRTGLLQQDGRGLYSVGSLGFALGRADSGLETARAIAVAALKDLVSQTGETVFVSCWGQTGPVILKVEDAPKPIAIRPTTKGDLPLTNSATGRVFAAFMDADEVRRLAKTELAASGIPVRERAARLREFGEHLVDVRRRGLARTTGERYPGLISFSAPIFDHKGHVAFALTSFGLLVSFPSSWNADVPVALRNCAARLTERIGGHRPQQSEARGVG
jgi:DNA-binding IclR family transcriptional regulator